MNTNALWQLLAEAIPLSAFPFLFYWFLRTNPATSRNPTMAYYGKGLIFLVCFISYLSVAAYYVYGAFMIGWSPTGVGAYPLNRLLQHPLQVPISLIVFPLTAVGLALAKKGTLGLWVFATGAGFTSYWAGLGWLPAEMDWLFVVAFAIIGGLCGMAAGLILSRVSQPQERSSMVRVWSAVGAGSATLGMVAGWLGVQAAIHRRFYFQSDPTEWTPFSINPGVMLPLLLIVVAVWLSVSALVAILTGYIRLGRRLRTKSAAPEQSKSP